MDSDELQEELGTLRRGYDELFEKLETVTDVVDEMVRALFGGENVAIDWAKRLDRLAERREWMNAEDAGLVWLRRLRDDLVSFHQVNPVFKEAVRSGRMRPLKPHERLRLVAAPRAEPSSPEAPSSPATDSPALPPSEPHDGD